MKYNSIKLLLMGIVITGVEAKMNVTQVDNMLHIESADASGIVTKIVGPDHKIISKKIQKGNSANVEIPVNLKDGVYHYEIHAGNQFKGGMIKIRNGKVQNNMPSHRKDRK